VLEHLESRRLLSVNIATFPLRGQGTYPEGIATGAGTDQNIWFTLSSNGGNIGMINPLNPGAGVTQYAIPTYNSGPGPIAAGPDGNYWFFEEAGDQFGVINPISGQITEIPLLTTTNPQVEGITAGPNGTVWFTEFNTDQIGMINTANDQIAEFPVITPGAEPYGIVQGPDGNIWFTEAGANQVGMINPTTHVMQEFPIDSSGNDEAEGIAVGPDDNLWFTLAGTDEIGVMNPTTGAMVTEHPVTTANAKPDAIALGPAKGAMWFTESGANQIATISTTGTVTEFAAYGSNSTPIGLAPGSDGGMWYVESNQVGIERLKAGTSTSYPYAVTKTGAAFGIAPDSQGNLWFAQEGADQVGVFSPATDTSTEEAVPISKAAPLNVAQGPDPNMWFTEFGPTWPSDHIGTIDSLTGQITETGVAPFPAQPYDIVYDPVDGNLYFTEWAANFIGRINPTTGAGSEYSIPTPKAFPEMITVDASGNVWFLEPSVKQIAELSPSDPGVINEYPVPGDGGGIVAGPDGNIWFTENVNSVWEVAVFSPSSHTVIARHTVTGGVNLTSITVGPDQNLWFTDGSGKIGMITTAGKITEYPVPNAYPVVITSAPDGNLWFTASGSTGVIGVVTLTAASIPTQLAVTTQPPAAVTAGKGFGLVISVENAAGDPDPDYTGSVTIALASNPGGDTLGGTLMAPVNHGVAVFPGLTLHHVSTGYTIQATATGLTSVTTDPFNVTPGATMLQVTTQPPAYVGAGTSFGLTVAAVDGQSNVDTTYNGPITLTLGTHPAGSTLGGVLVVGATDGVATFTGLSLSVLGDYTIVASNGYLNPAPTATFVVTGPATQLAITSPALNQVAGNRGAIMVQLEDSSGNPGATSTSDQTIGLTTTSSAGSFYAGLSGGNAITSVVIVAGQSSATVYYMDTQAGGPTVTASDSAFKSSPPSQQETITPAAVDHLGVATSFASPDAAGTAATVTVTAYDRYSNVVGSGPNPFEGTVDLSSTDTRVAGLPASYTFTAGDAGSHAFNNVVLKTAGNQTFAATYTGPPTATGTSAAVDVVPGSATGMVITSAPLTLVAGSRGPVDVELEDSYGNLGATSTSDQAVSLGTTSPAAAFYASSSGGSAITSLTIPAGQSSATFYYADIKKGTPTITASASPLGSVLVQQEKVDPAPASKVVITSAPLTLAAGSRGLVTLGLEDRYGNLGATATADQTIGLVTASSAGGFYAGASGGNPMTAATIPAGQSSATVYYGDTQAGTPTVTVSDTALSSSVNQVETVNSAPADHFVVTTSFPSSDAAGTPGTVTVTAKDQFGNTAGGGLHQYLGTVDLSSTDSQTSGLPATYTFTAGDAGSHTLSDVVLRTAGSQTIKAADSGEPTVAGEATVNVVRGAISRVEITSLSLTLVAGTRGPVSVQLEDAYGNPGAISSAAQTIGLGTTGAAGAFYATQAGSAPIASVVIPAGQSSATVYYGDTQAGTPTITASDTGLHSSVNQPEAVVPAAADHFVVTTTFPTPDVAGTAATVTVAAYDHYNNLAGSGPNRYEATVMLSSTDSQVGGLPASYTFTAGDAGSHTFSNVVLITAGDQTITAGGLAPASTRAIAVSPAAPAKWMIHQQPPATALAGTPFATQPVVYEEDRYGNLETGDNTTVVTAALASGSGPLQGMQSVVVKGGVAVFTDLADSIAETITLEFRGGGLPTVLSSPITVTEPGNPGGGSQAPTIVGEQVLMAPVKGKKGKKSITGFVLEYSGAMDSTTAGSSSNYKVNSKVTKPGKKKTGTSLRPVAFTSFYNAAKNSVTLILSGKQAFAKGGEIIVNYSEIFSADNEHLSSDDATLTIAAKGTGITQG
jgi:streptogramin lyase